MKRNIKFLALFVLAIILLPTSVFATNVTVNVLTNPSDQSSKIAEINAEKDVTTVAQLKEALINENIGLDDYIVYGSWNEPISDDVIICDGSLSCYQDGENWSSVLLLMPVKHDKKTFTLKSIPAKDENMFEGLVQTNYEMFGNLMFRSCNDTFDFCKFEDLSSFTLYDNVVIKYDYDKDIAKIAQKMVDDGLLNKNEFTTTDTELLHYIRYGGSLANYTSEFKNQVSNLNFSFELDQRGGGFDPFETGAIGFYKFVYGDTIYAIKNYMGITAPHVIYVPSDTTDIKTAIEKRIKDIFGDNSFFAVTESNETVNELLTANGEQPVSDGDQNYYILKIVDPDSPRYENEYFFIAKKDSSKINNTVAFRSKDLVTKVTVSSDENIPLDTLVNVNHITKGDSYNKIIKALNISEGEMFDINLYSNAQKKNIKKLDNGKFLVSIPVPEKYNGKDLIVYYVDESNKVTEYEVKVEYDKTSKSYYASFETDHFSVYTLAVTDSDITSTSATGNPKTGDNIIINISLLGLSIIGIAGICYSRKRTNQ